MIHYWLNNSNVYFFLQNGLVNGVSKSSSLIHSGSGGNSGSGNNSHSHNSSVGGSSAATTTTSSVGTSSDKATPSTDPKPVECNLCHRKFKNIPALNGHMRLHGGYFKKVNNFYIKIYFLIVIKIFLIHTLLTAWSCLMLAFAVSKCN